MLISRWVDREVRLKEWGTWKSILWRCAANRPARQANPLVAAGRTDGAALVAHERSYDAYRVSSRCVAGTSGPAGSLCAREKKLEQVAAAEKLLSEIDLDRIYTYEYLCYRITRFRSEAYRDVKFIGRDAKHDLGLFVEDLSDAANVAAGAAGERVMTVAELASRFNVSTKTISRWRRLGLISRRFVVDGRKRIGFLESSVDRFVAQNSDKVRRGSQFSQLSESERSVIIARARRLAQAGGGPAEVVRRIARKTGRSSETIRYTLKQFDQENADFAIFPDSHGRIHLDANGRSTTSFIGANRPIPLPSGFAARGPASTALFRKSGRGSWANCRWTTSRAMNFRVPSGRRSASRRFSAPCPSLTTPSP